VPDIDFILEKSTKKKFKKSSYRPWNYMEEMQKEESQQKPIVQSKIYIEKNSSAQAEVLEKQIIPEKIEKTIEVIEKPEFKFINEKNEKIDEIYLNYKGQSNSPLYTILRLSGHQKLIFNFILEKCLTRNLLTTGIVTSEILINLTNTSLTMVNTSIQRLVEKGLVNRENGKRGRGGFYCFGIAREIKDAAIEYRRIANIENIEPLKANENQPLKIDPSFIEIKKIIQVLPPEWEEIDIEPLHHIGFTKGHIVQLFKQGEIDITTLQDSIYYFSYDLQHNNKADSITKSSPLGYFMGILKRIGLYNAPENYESFKNRALREMLESKKNEKEKRDNMLKELIHLAFEEWHGKLSQEEKDNFIPNEIRKTKLLSAKQASLKSYFTEHVWPSLAPKI